MKVEEKALVKLLVLVRMVHVFLKLVVVLLMVKLTLLLGVISAVPCWQELPHEYIWQ